MYLNHQILENKNLTPAEFALLLIIKQNKNEKNGDIIEKYLDVDTSIKFEQMGLVEYVKEKSKKDRLVDRARTTKKANDCLEDIETPEILEQDLIIFEWLKNIFLSSDKEIGNARKCKVFISLFRANSGIIQNNLSFLCQTFFHDGENFDYCHRLEYLFWKAPNLYATKFDIHQSRLYMYYLKRKDYFDKEFEKLDKKHML